MSNIVSGIEVFWGVLTLSPHNPYVQEAEANPQKLNS